MEDRSTLDQSHAAPDAALTAFNSLRGYLNSQILGQVPFSPPRC